jgi:Protein of unknown function (DUF5132)
MAREYATGVVMGVALSLGAALLGPLWRPALGRWARPAAKGAIKQGILAFELGRERIAELGEKVSDLVAEAQFELAAGRLHEQEAGAAPDGAPPVEPAPS